MISPTEKVVSFNPPSQGYWIIPSEKGDLWLANTLLPAMTQDDLATHKTDEEFHALSMPEHFELFNALYELRNTGGAVEEARQFIQASLRTSFPNTLTRLEYMPEGKKDKVIHGYGTNSPIEQEVNLVGSNGLVTKVLTLEASQALTGKTPEQVEELMGYINNTQAYVRRVNNSPKEIDERVARFLADSNWAGLDGGRDPRGQYPAFGVRHVREASQK